MNKKIQAIGIVTALAVSLAGCSKPAVRQSATTEPATIEETKAYNISLEIDSEKIKLHGKTIYMTKQNVAMLPLEVLQEELDIAVNKYKDGRVELNKADMTVNVHIGSDKVKIGDNQFALTEEVVKTDDTIYIPVTLLEYYLRFTQNYNPKTKVLSLSDVTKGNDLPERYSYVDVGRSPKIQNQGKSDTCWMYAAYTALESTLLPTESLDISKKRLLQYNSDFLNLASGFNYEKPLYYFLSWNGPVDQKYDKSTDYKVAKHLQSAQMFEGKNIKKIKQLVFKYGGVETSCYMDEKIEEHTQYYNKKESAYYTDRKFKNNHALVIVGWDDNYSKTNFAKQPEKDGAFICQNSWGKKFGDNGIMYISYEDANIGSQNICYTKVEDADNYKDIQQSDEYGWIETIGINESNTAFFANVFQPTYNSANLSAVGFYATEDNTDYEVYFVPTVGSRVSLSRLGESVAYGTLSGRGYYTIKLDEPIALKDGKKYAVVVKASNKNTSSLIACETNPGDGRVKVDLKDGQGYYSADGQYWQRAENEGFNICLKAYLN